MISVCIATYNGEKYIYQQLKSILKQLRENDEIIISDDSSNDRTLEIVRIIDDKRIKLLENNKFYSPIYNFENALKKASGDTIFLSDQDDVWEDNKIAVMLALVSRYDVIISDCTVIDENDRVLYESFFKLMNSGKGLLKNFHKNTALGCCMVFNRRILKKALPFPPNLPMHDWWIYMIGELFGEVHFCEEKLIRYRRHASNKTSTTDKSPYKLYKKLFFRINLFYNLIKRTLK